MEKEEQHLHKRREELRLNTEIAEQMKKLEVLMIKSTTSGRRASNVSDGMNSYLKRAQPKRMLNVNADEFILNKTEPNMNTNTISREQNQMQFQTNGLALI